MIRKAGISFLIFTAVNFAVCALSHEFSYFTAMEIFDFYSDKTFSLILLMFNVFFVAYTIIFINSLIEEKEKIGKYIKIRNGKAAHYKHVFRLCYEVSVFAFSKIAADFLFWWVFDRTEFKQFLRFSILIFLSQLLWMALFDMLVNLRVKNNIIILFFITAIYICYLLYDFSSVFSVFIIHPLNIESYFTETLLLKGVITVAAVIVDLLFRSKKEFY